MSITIPATGPGTIVPAVATESHGTAGHFQLIKLTDGNVGSLTPVGTSANPFNVYQPGIQTIIGSIGVTQISGPWSVIGSLAATQVGAPWSIVGSVIVAANSPFIIEGDISHSSADPLTSFPVKIGGYAVTSSFPAAVNSGARVNALFDKVGRFITMPYATLGMNQNKHNDFTGPLSGTVVWSAGVNGRICVTDLRVMAGSATAGIVSIYFARSGAPINFTVGSGVCLFRGEMAPSATAKPGAVVPFNFPTVGDANDALRISITTTMQIYVQAGGFEA